MKLLFLGLLLASTVCFSSSQNNIKNTQITKKLVQNPIILRNSATDSFVSYWKSEFKPEGVRACDISKEKYLEMMDRYLDLTKDEQAEVNIVNDLEEGYTIGDVIKTLVNKYYPNQQSIKDEKPKLDQRSIIIIASVISIVGMSAISVLYILKNRKLIK